MNTRKRVSVEAAAWISRLNADDRTPAVDAACQEWLNAHPQHRAAFEIANRMWDDAATLPVSLAARIGRSDLTPAELAPLRAERRNMPRRWLAAAGVVLAVFTGAMWYVQRPQILETATGQQLTVPLEDGSRVILNTETRARVRFDEHARRIELESGEALFDVAKDSARPFIVRAGDREITALGTQFVVRQDEKQTAVTLVEGKVSVNGDVASEGRVTASLPSPSRSRRSHPSPVERQDPSGLTVLEPGERLTFVEKTRVASILLPALDAVTAWRKGEIVFENTPLSTAIEEMNRYSVRKLKLSAGAPAQMPVSGLFRSADAENFALALTNTHPLEAIELGSEIEIRAR